MDVKLRKALRAKIPHGDITKIAKDSGLSRVTVSKWFNGTDSYKVEQAVLNYVKSKKEEKEDNTKTVSEFINN